MDVSELYSYSYNSTEFKVFLKENFYKPVLDTNTGNIWYRGELFGNAVSLNGADGKVYPNTYNIDFFMRSKQLNNFDAVNLRSDNYNAPKYNVVVGIGHNINSSPTNEPGQQFNVIIGNAYNNNGGIEKNAYVSYTNIFANKENVFRSPIIAGDVQANVSNSYVTSLGKGADLNTVLKALLTTQDYSAIPGVPSVSCTTTNTTVEAYTAVTARSITYSVNWNTGSFCSKNPRWMYAHDGSKFVNLTTANYNSWKADLLKSEGGFFKYLDATSNKYKDITESNTDYVSKIVGATDGGSYIKTGKAVYKAAGAYAIPNSSLFSTGVSYYEFITSGKVTNANTATDNVLNTWSTTSTCTYGTYQLTPVTNATWAPGSNTLMTWSQGLKSDSKIESNSGTIFGSLRTFFDSLAQTGVFVLDEAKKKSGTTGTVSGSGTVSLSAGFKFYSGTFKYTSGPGNFQTYVKNKMDNASSESKNPVNTILDSVFGSGNYSFITNGNIQTTNESATSSLKLQVSSTAISSSHNGFFFLYPMDKLKVSQLTAVSTQGSAVTKDGGTQPFMQYTSDGESLNLAVIVSDYSYNKSVLVTVGNTEVKYLLCVAALSSGSVNNTKGYVQSFIQKTCTGTL